MGGRQREGAGKRERRVRAARGALDAERRAAPRLRELRHDREREPVGESVRAWDALHEHYGEPSFEWDVWLAPEVTLYSKRITPFYEKRACRTSR